MTHIIQSWCNTILKYTQEENTKSKAKANRYSAFFEGAILVIKK